MTQEDPMAAPGQEQLKKYEALFTLQMPGNQKPQTYKIEVDAEDPSIAMIVATDKWNNLVAPRDVRIKEIVPKEG